MTIHSHARWAARIIAGSCVHLRDRVFDLEPQECTFKDGERGIVDVFFRWRVASPLTAVLAPDVTLALETMVASIVFACASRVRLGDILLDTAPLAASIQQQVGCFQECAANCDHHDDVLPRALAGH